MVIETNPSGAQVQKQVETAVSEGESTTTAGTYQDKTTLTFTAEAGDYKLEFYAEYYNGDVRVYNSTDAVTYAEVEEISSLYYTSIGGLAVITLTAGSKSIIIQWLSNGGTAYIRRARLYLVKM